MVSVVWALAAVNASGFGYVLEELPLPLWGIGIGVWADGNTYKRDGQGRRVSFFKVWCMQKMALKRV
jgi:hypothetical protein